MFLNSQLSILFKTFAVGCIVYFSHKTHQKKLEKILRVDTGYHQHIRCKQSITSALP